MLSDSADKLFTSSPYNRDLNPVHKSYLSRERKLLTVLDHESLVRSANELEPLPQSVQRLSTLTEDPNCEIRDIVRAVELDASLAGKLLRLASSSAYGQGNVTSIDSAVVRLGFDTVKSIAVASSVQPIQSLDLSFFDLTPKSYWRHSVATLSFAEELAAQTHRRFKDLPMAALLHDYGKLVLSEHINDHHIELQRNRHPDTPAHEHEMCYLSVNHAEVSAVVAQAWNLPEELVRAIQYHHTPAMADNPICYGLTLANHLAWRLESRDDKFDQESESRESAFEALNLTENEFELILEKGTKRLHEIMTIYN